MRRLIRRILRGQTPAALAPSYSPSLDFSDDRNSMYAGCLN